MSKPKGNKNFMSLSNSECKLAYEFLMKNANALYNDAKLLASNGSYGPATSMLIHSTEETMKAFVLFLDSNGFDFRRRVKGIKNLFDNHKLRYGLAMFLSILYILSEDIKTFFLDIKSNPKNFHELIKNKEQIGTVLLEYIRKKIIVIIQEVIWFSNAEFLRQKGFYVDYVDEIKTPLQISNVDFENVLIRIDGMRSFVSNFVLSFESSDVLLTHEIDKLKLRFIEEKWYENIGKLIEIYKDRETNPLDVLSKKLNEFKDELNNTDSIIEE